MRRHGRRSAFARRSRCATRPAGAYAAGREDPCGAGAERSVCLDASALIQRQPAVQEGDVRRKPNIYEDCRRLHDARRRANSGDYLATEYLLDFGAITNLDPRLTEDAAAI